MSCLIEKNNYFCTRFEIQAQNLKQTETSSVQEFRLNNKKNNVPRHIELTAVLAEMLKQTKRE